MATTQSSSGTVDSFDDPAGLGEIVSDDGRRYPFHCTQIADGSRTISAGASVVFDVMAGHGGTWEATRIRPA